MRLVLCGRGVAAGTNDVNEKSKVKNEKNGFVTFFAYVIRYGLKLIFSIHILFYLRFIGRIPLFRQGLVNKN